MTEASVTRRLRQQRGPVFAVARRSGAWAGSAWGTGETTFAATVAAVSEAVSDLTRPRCRSVDRVELCLSHSFRDVDPRGSTGRLLTNVHVGVLGLEIQRGRDTATYSPTLMLANNWDFDDAMERFAEAYDIEVRDLHGPGTRLRVFGCDQALVTLGERPVAVTMERGNTEIPLKQVNERSVTRLASLMGSWLTTQVRDDGRMTYEYWPSRSEESGFNNMIRQWMATVALDRLADERGGTRRSTPSPSGTSAIISITSTKRSEVLGSSSSPTTVR